MQSFRGIGRRNNRRNRPRAINRVEAELNVIKSQVGQMRTPANRSRRTRNINRFRRVRRTRNTRGRGNRGLGANNIISTGSNNSRGAVTTIGKILRAGGAIAGGFLGNPSAGSAVGAGISRIFGQGDYTVTNNSLVHGGPPSFAALNTGMRVAHREYVQDILGSVNFRNTTFQISPTNATLFPWLNRLAFNFEEYIVHGLVFYFNTTCGNAISGTNNALGVVGMTTVYDPTDPPLASKREAEDYGGAVSGVPSCSLLHPVECKPRSNVLDRMYIQTQPVSDQDDLKFYSHGKLNVFTQGMQIDNVNIGELWVSYDIEFFNPKILPVGTVGAAASKISSTVVTMGANQVFGTNDLSSIGNLGCTYTGVDGRIRIPQGTAAGYYYLNAMSSTASSTYTLAWGIPSNNVVLTNYFQGTSTPQITTPNASAANAWHGTSVVLYKTDANEASIGCSVVSGSIVAPQQFDITITKVPGSIFGLADVPMLSDIPKLKQQQPQQVEGMVYELVQKYLKQMVDEPLSDDTPDSDDC